MFRTIFLVAAATVCGGALQAAGTRVLFDPTDPDVGPFPTDALTVSDPNQYTGLRMNLPLPDCQAEPSTCTEISLINQLDGFNINPRIRVRFSGPIEVETLRDGIFFVFFSGMPGDEYRADRILKITRINQVLYDPATNTAYAKPDEILHQHSRYALVVTDAIRDIAGEPVVADPAYLSYLDSSSGGGWGLFGRWGLGRVVASVAHLFQPREIVAASWFTTLSTTLWLEKARDQLENTQLGLEMTGPKSVFKISELASITPQFQTKLDPPQSLARPVWMHLLQGVDRVAFGSFSSPSFLNENQVIPTVPTGEEVALPPTVNRIHFHVYLPDSPAPPDGYPVVIAPGNAGGERFYHSTSYASRFALRGMATIAIDAVGRSHGPGGKVLVQEKSGSTVELPLGGRAVDVNGDGAFGSAEGCAMGLAAPVPVFDRDCNRQTALDLHQLVRAIKAGIDLDGDRVVDLDRSRIYYHGMSAGSMYGPVFVAVSPDVAAAVLNTGGGSRTDVYRWTRGPATFAQRVPPLLNKDKSYDEDYVLRDRPVEIIDVPGAVAIQEFFERCEWLLMLGDPVAYAPHLKSSTLTGVPIKRVLFQYAKGDRVVPNPTETALVRAANMRETTSYYRHDLALGLFPTLNPAGHYFSMPTTAPFFPSDPLGQYLIAMLVQEEGAGFLASHGTVIPDMNVWTQVWFGVNLFETPPDFLTEDLN